MINRWLIAEGGLDIHDGEVIGVCAESHCTYSGGFAFPEDIEAGLRVGKLGNSSVRYEIGLFAAGAEEPVGDRLVRARVRRRGDETAGDDAGAAARRASSACRPARERRS